MTTKEYNSITSGFRQHPKRIRALNIANTVLAAVFYISYPLLLVYLGYTHNPFLSRALIVPAIAFVIVTVFRRTVSAARPYEVLDITPLINKKKVGHSFPSRHIFSAFMVASTFAYVNLPFGIVLYILGALLALIRVVGGVHFPRDVFAGSALGVLCGIIGYFLVP